MVLPSFKNNARVYYKVLQAQHALLTQAHTLLQELAKKNVIVNYDMHAGKIADAIKHCTLASKHAEHITTYFEQLDALIFVEKQTEYADILKNLQQEITSCTHECHKLHTLLKTSSNLPESINTPLRALAEKLHTQQPLIQRVLSQLERSCL